MTAHEQPRLAALHEYRLLGAVLGYARAGHRPTGVEPFDLGEPARFAVCSFTVPAVPA